MSASEYYDHSSYPAQGAAGSSAAARAEFAAVENGISAKLPDLAGNGGKIVAVNAGASALEAVTTTGTGNAVRANSPTLATPTIGQANFTSVGAYAVTMTFTGITGITFPQSGTLATLAGNESLSNKTLVAPALGTPASGVLTNCTGTAAGLTAGAANSLAAGATATALMEDTTISATAASGAINFDVSDQSVLYYTDDASANFTLNFRWSSGASLDSQMAVGESVTCVFMNTNGATPYYPTAFQIDGNAVTPKWQGAIAPAAGNASSVDVYTFTIMKTGSAAFTVLASQTRFA